VSLSVQLDDALATTPRLPRDAVAVALAYRYAAALDDCFDALTEPKATEDPAEHARKVLEIARLGQRLEQTLDRLGMSPSARPAVTGSGGGEHGPTPAAGELERLRADAAAGAPTSGLDHAASVDPAVTEADSED
jgi:hypothetical protein